VTCALLEVVTCTPHAPLPRAVTCAFLEVVTCTPHAPLPNVVTCTLLEVVTCAPPRRCHMSVPPATSVSLNCHLSCSSAAGLAHLPCNASTQKGGTEPCVASAMSCAPPKSCHMCLPRGCHMHPSCLPPTSCHMHPPRRCHMRPPPPPPPPPV
jgi:hypothetical protein